MSPWLIALIAAEVVCLVPTARVIVRDDYQAIARKGETYDLGDLLITVCMVLTFGVVGAIPYIAARVLGPAVARLQRDVLSVDYSAIARAIAETPEQKCDRQAKELDEVRARNVSLERELLDREAS